jgi:hypothetical protein
VSSGCLPRPSDYMSKRHGTTGWYTATLFGALTGSSIIFRSNESGFRAKYWPRPTDWNASFSLDTIPTSTETNPLVFKAACPLLSPQITGKKALLAKNRHPAGRDLSPSGA